MKKILIALVSICLLVNATCQEKAKTDDEKKAIMKVLLEAGKLFSEYNMAGLSALHITDESATRFDGVKVYKGWDEIDALFKSYMEMNPDFKNMNAKNEKENAIVKVTGNTAWVICDNMWKWEENGQSQSVTNKEISFLEKKDGKWKIAFNAFIAISDQ